MSLLTEADDLPHRPSERSDWRESYYFNFVDLESGISGFTTIGLLPNLKRREFVFVLFYDGKREAHFMEPEGPFPPDSDKALSNGHLEYGIVEPLKEWRIRFSGDNIGADLTWKGRFPAYCFSGCSKTSWSDHFEQSGVVTGMVDLPGGRKVEINGLGQRDKSWGPRDWHIEGWYALHAQFKSLSIGLRRDIINGSPVVSGGVSKAEGHVAVDKVDLETTFMEGTKIPTGSLTRIFSADGKVYTLKSSLITPTSFVKFARPFANGSTELFEEMAVHECQELVERATGLIEWLFTYPKNP